MIFYFSGTGNSQLVAKRLASEIDDEVISITDMLQQHHTAPIDSLKPMIFVAPTYAWRMPRIVDKWIRDTVFYGSDKAYFVLTCGGDCGNPAVYIKKLCAKKNFVFKGLASVVMPNNYLILEPPPEKAKADEMIAKAEPIISNIAKQIKAGETLPDIPVSFAGRLESGPINVMFNMWVNDKGFVAHDGCVGCGRCAKRCPLGNITMENNRPKWHGNCTHCMACIDGCFTETIEYKNKTQGRPRYYIMDEPNEKG